MLLAVLAWGYIFWLGSFLLLRFAFQDRWWWLGLSNSLTIYWFLPLIFIPPTAFYTRNLALWGAFLFAVAVFIALFGRQFVPKRRDIPVGERTLTVMTYNLLNMNHQASAIIETVLAAQSDIIAFQEITPEVGPAIQSALKDVYPYQIFGSEPGEASFPYNSLVSRYPVRLSGNHLPGYWRVPPRIYELDIGGIKTLIIAAHGQPISLGTMSTVSIAEAFKIRQQQASTLASFSAHAEHPLIVLTDFNTTDQNQAYRTITRQMVDAWREAGWGLGFTFGLRRHTFGASRPINFPLPLPRWLLRIDFIFHSKEWQAIKVRLGKWDQVSDHRPVIATLRLCPP